MNAALKDMLLAKSVRAGRAPVTLQEHSFDTERAAALLFDPARRFGRSFCRFFRVAGQDQEHFLLNLRVAALFHDLGKANEDFLAAVKHERFEPQTLRHEHLSALVLHLPQVKTWLGGNAQLDHDVITAAVLSHHVKAGESGDHKWCQKRGGKSSVSLFLQHAEVDAILSRVRAVANLGPVPALPASRWADAPPWCEAFQRGSSAARALSRAFRAKDALTQSRRSLLLAVKAGVMAADAASSAIVREDLPFEDWINDAVHGPSLLVEDIERAVLVPRIREIELRRGEPFVAQRFQDATAELGPRALVQAACGAGKTIAAWKWAAAQAQTRDIGRVVFLYPTRGTATEGFRDYVAAAPEGEGALVHASSRYELQAMRDNPNDEPKATRHALSEAELRLFALGLWSRRYFSATVDQFLGFLEHAYGSLCLLPVLADAAVVVDEVHSFDGSMFASLLALLETFDIPVLCMTATLPPIRRKALEAAGLVVYPREEHRAELSDLELLEGHPRYSVSLVPSAEACLEVVVAACREGKRVLWVENQVAWAQDRARALSALLGSPVLCYHSRFKLEDRQRIHRQTVSAFQPNASASIAVTTQVCEMSLDLDADVLVTALAPSTALVQRFGRANRNLHARSAEFRAQVFVYEPENARPYERAELEAAKAFLKTIGQNDVSQRKLAEALEVHSRQGASPQASARFLDAGYYATPGSFRDSDEFTRSCFLDRDLDQVRRLLKEKRPVDGLVVPTPYNNKLMLSDEARPSWLPPFYGVVDSAAYDATLGLLASRKGDFV